MDYPSPTFCALPWIHLSTRPNGHMRVCCTANASAVQDPNSSIRTKANIRNEDGQCANLNTTRLLDAWNNDYMKRTRLMMMKGERPPQCEKCFKEEDAGHIPKRVWETNKWGEIYDLNELVKNTNEDGSVAPKLRYIDLRMGSKCQLACVMCSPNDSSGWNKEWLDFYPKIKNERLKDTSQWKKNEDGGTYNWHKMSPHFWEDLYEQIPNIYQLYFAGGESTIIDEHYTLLEKVIEMGYAPKIELRYNSNGIELPDKLFKLWSEFKHVIFHFSIDSWGKYNDYIRYPSRWKIIEKNLKLMDQTDDNITVTTATTIMALSINYLPEFISWKVQQGYKKINKWPGGAGMINCHLAYWPPQLNVKIIPKELKYKIREKYEEEFFPWMEDNWKLCTGVENIEFDDWANSSYGIKRYEGLLNFMDDEDWSERLPEFQEYISHLNRLRPHKQFEKVFPELCIDMMK